MNKSDFLDELRLEIGLVPEYANTLQEFYTGIVRVLGKRMQEIDYNVLLYESGETSFSLTISSGNHQHPAEEQFGEGQLSLCAIRGDIYTYPCNEYICIMAPFYQGHHLLGLLVIDVHELVYTITEEDIIFMKEVCRFIEVQHSRYDRSFF